MTMLGKASKFSVQSLQDRGWLGLSGVMAAFCALLGAAIGLFAVAMTILCIVMTFVAIPQGHWSWGAQGAVTPSAGANATFQSSGTPGSVEVIKCAPPPNAKTCTRTQRPATVEESRPKWDDQAYILISTAIELGPILALSFGLLQASACFVAFAKGNFFSRSTTTRLRDFALGGLIFILVFPHANAISGAVGDAWGSAKGAVLSMLAGHGTRITVNMGEAQVFASGVKLSMGWITFDGDKDFTTLMTTLYAFTLAIIAAVMAKASGIAEDHAQIV